MSGVLANYFAAAQDFPTSLPITNTNLFITRQVSGLVPTNLKIERTADQLSVAIDTNEFELTNFIVDTNMAVVCRSEVFIYPEGKPKPTKWQWMATSGVLDFNLGTGYCHTKPDGIPQAATKYVVEMNLAILERALPLKEGRVLLGPSYKIIWQRTLKQVVQ